MPSERVEAVLHAIFRDVGTSEYAEVLRQCSAAEREEVSRWLHQQSWLIARVAEPEDGE